MSGLSVNTGSMVALSEQHIRTASIGLAVIAAVLLMVLGVQNFGGGAQPESDDMLAGKSTDSPLKYAPVKNYRLPTVAAGASSAPVKEGEGEILTREQYEADLRALQTHHNK